MDNNIAEPLELSPGKLALDVDTSQHDLFDILVVSEARFERIEALFRHWIFAQIDAFDRLRLRNLDE